MAKKYAYVKTYMKFLFFNQFVERFCTTNFARKCELNSVNTQISSYSHLKSISHYNNRLLITVLMIHT